MTAENSVLVKTTRTIVLLQVEDPFNRPRCSVKTDIAPRGEKSFSAAGRTSPGILPAYANYRVHVVTDVYSSLGPPPLIIVTCTTCSYVVLT